MIPQRTFIFIWYLIHSWWEWINIILAMLIQVHNQMINLWKYCTGNTTADVKIRSPLKLYLVPLISTSWVLCLSRVLVVNEHLLDFEKGVEVLLPQIKSGKRWTRPKIDNFSLITLLCRIQVGLRLLINSKSLCSVWSKILM